MVVPLARTFNPVDGAIEMITVMHNLATELKIMVFLLKQTNIFSNFSKNGNTKKNKFFLCCLQLALSLQVKPINR